MATLLEKANQILAEKNNVQAENIKVGTTFFDIEGTLQDVAMGTADATATSGDIIAGTTAYVGGTKLEGTVVRTENLDLATAVAVENAGDSIKITGNPAEETEIAVNNSSNIVTFCPDSEIVKAKGITSSQIKQGETVLGVSGTGQTGVDTTDATATANDILKDKTAYAGNEIITGTIETVENIDTSAAVSVGESETTFSTTIGERKLAEAGTSIKLKTGNSSLATAIGLTADILAEGSTVLGVNGTADIGGIDTSDATAGYADILYGKIAYVKGQKVTGWMENNGTLNYTPSTVAQSIPEGYTSGGTIAAVTSAIDANLIPENVRAGVTILDVTGTAGSGTGGVKLFTSQEDLNADTGTSGDLAIVYSDAYKGMSKTDKVSTFFVPNEVVLDAPFSGNVDNDCQTTGDLMGAHLRFSATSFELNIDTMDSMYMIEFYSDDGITYTNDGSSRTISLPGTFTPRSGQGWDDQVGKFIQIPTKAFEGLYQHDGSSYSYAPTQFTATAGNQLMPGVCAYGPQGVVTGDASIYSSLNYKAALNNIGFDPFKNNTILFTYNKVANNAVIDLETPEYGSNYSVCLCKMDSRSSNEGYYLRSTELYDIYYKYDNKLNYFRVCDKLGNMLYEETIETTVQLTFGQLRLVFTYNEGVASCVCNASDSAYTLHFGSEDLTYETATVTGFLAGVYYNGVSYVVSKPASRTRAVSIIESGTVTTLETTSDIAELTAAGQVFVGKNGYVYAVAGDRYSSSYGGVFYVIDSNTKTLVSSETSKNPMLARDMDDHNKIYLLKYDSGYNLYAITDDTYEVIKSSVESYLDGFTLYFANSTGDLIQFDGEGIEVNGKALSSTSFDRELTQNFHGRMETSAWINVNEENCNSKTFEWFVETYMNGSDGQLDIGVIKCVYHFDKKMGTEGNNIALPFNDGGFFRLLLSNEEI